MLFFLPILRLYATRWVMTALQYIPFVFFSFLLYLAAISRRDFWVFPLLSLHKKVFTFFRSHPNSLSLARRSFMLWHVGEKKEEKKNLLFSLFRFLRLYTEAFAE